MSNKRVFASTHTTTETVIGRPADIVGVYYVAAGTAGSIVLRDGGASGATRLNIATPASATVTQWLDIPGDGFRCDTDIHITITSVTSVTVVYA